MPRASLLPKFLARPAMIFLAVAQMILALVPLVEGQGVNSTPHVEQAGIAAHHSHDEASCAACVARTLVTSSVVQDTPDYRVTGRFSVRGQGTLEFPTDPGLRGLQARAPPLNRA